MNPPAPTLETPPREGLFAGLSRKHALVLLIAYLGWVFDLMDVFLLVLVKDSAMKELLGANSKLGIAEAGGIALGITLIGWSLGGLIFGVVADRWGRTRTMALTILLYSIFTGACGFAQTFEQFLALRFLASLGIGGEWGAGASLIAEVFPRSSRSVAAGILQSASGTGFFVAIFVFWLLGDNWRYVFFAGAVPAFLALLVRMGLSEPEAWVAAKEKSAASTEKKFGSLAELFSNPVLRRRVLCGTGVALIGIFAYWGTNFWAKEALVDILKKLNTPKEKMANYITFGLAVMNVGNICGFLTYIPLTERVGRRWAFVWFHLGAVLSMPAAFLFSDSYNSWLALFFIAGLFTSGIFSGYTIYFPELFPTRLRATGAGFCYNVGRVVAAPGPYLMGYLIGYVGTLGFEKKIAVAGAIMSCFYLLVFPLIPLLPETKGARLDTEDIPAETA